MISNVKQKFNATTWLIIPNVLLCLSIGFIGIMLFKEAYSQINAVENTDIFFNAFKVSILAIFLMGYSVKRFIKHHNKEVLNLELTCTTLLALISGIIYYFSSGIMQVDYIFYTKVFYAFTYVLAFSFGIFLADLRNFRLWAFLIGIGSFLSYTSFVPISKFPSGQLLVTFLILLTVEILLISVLSKFKPIIFYKHEQNTYQLLHLFFYSGISFLICHLGLFYMRADNFIDPFFLGIVPALLLFNILYSYGYLKRKVRLKYYLGIVLLTVNFYFTLKQSNLEGSYPYLLFIDTGFLALYRPYKIDFKKLTLSLLVGIVAIALSIYLYSDASKTWLQIIAALSFPILLLGHFSYQKKLRRSLRAVAFAIAIALCYYSFTPMPLIYELNFEAKQASKFFPFLLSEIPFDQKSFIYYQTHLPFVQAKKLPKLSSIKNKTVVIESHTNRNLILTYILQLQKSNIPYILLQSKQEPSYQLQNWLPKIRNYSFFRIYYSKNLENKLFSRKNISKKYLYVKNKITNANSHLEIAKTLNQIIIYNYYYRDAAIRSKELFFQSYQKYADYFYKKKQYNQALQAIKLCYLFDKTNEKLNEKAFLSLLKLTPIESHIPIMEELQKNSKYKEAILNRLYPLYVRQKNYQLAIDKNEELIRLYQKSQKEDEIEDLKIEKAKLYIESANFIKAQSLIRSELRKDPESLRWNKVVENLNFHIEEKKRRSRDANYY